MSQDSTIEVIKAAPPAGALGAWVAGITLNEVVLLATLIYTVFLIIDKAPTVYQRLKAGMQWALRKGDHNGS